jgi:hypothetical protein
MRMNFYKAILVAILLQWIVKPINAQNKVDTLSSNYWAFSVNADYKIPLFDFSKRFGPPKSIGIALNKIDDNKIYTIGGNYWLGTRPKNDSILKDITIENQYFMGNNGNLIPFKLALQGFDINAGYQYRFSGQMEGGWYHGIFAGTYWYKNLIILNDESPVMTNQIKKGYDDLTIGGLLATGVYYKNISNTLNANYSFGLTYQLGIAQNVRGYSYLSNTDVKKGVLDSFISFNFSYYFPIKPGVKPDEIEDEGWGK